MLWDAEHNGETVTLLREDANSYVFDEDGTELVLSKANVVDLGDAHPPADKDTTKHYISTYDGSVSYGFSIPSSPQNSQSLPSSQNSGQSGGRRKSKGKKTKTKAKKSRKVNAKKSRKANAKKSRKANAKKSRKAKSLKK